MPQVAAAAAAPVPLAGTWRADIVMMTRAKVPVIGETVVETHKVALTTIAPDGSGQLAQHMKTCAMYARSNRKLASTWFPRSFVDTLDEQENPIQFSARDGTVTATVEPVHLGYDPVHSGGNMPRDKGDPAIRDPDGDGQPGTTIHVYAPIVGRVKVFIVQHTRTTLEGRLSGDEVRGDAVVTHMDQASLGASLPLFASNVPLQPVREGSWFTLRRMPDGAGCADLDRLAPPAPGTPAAERAGEKPPRED